MSSFVPYVLQLFNEVDNLWCQDAMPYKVRCDSSGARGHYDLMSLSGLSKRSSYFDPRLNDRRARGDLNYPFQRIALLLVGV